MKKKGHLLTIGPVYEVVISPMKEAFNGHKLLPQKSNATLCSSFFSLHPT